MQTNIENLDTNALFTQYINVVNRAIGAHRDEFPFKQLLTMGKELLGDKKIGAAVYKTDADSPHDYFTITFQNGKLRAEHGKKAPDISWKVKEAYLQKVVAKPDQYVDSPGKLDLDWLKSRLGI